MSTSLFDTNCPYVGKMAMYLLQTKETVSLKVQRDTYSPPDLPGSNAEIPVMCWPRIRV